MRSRLTHTVATDLMSLLTARSMCRYKYVVGIYTQVVDGADCPSSQSERVCYEKDSHKYVVESNTCYEKDSRAALSPTYTQNERRERRERRKAAQESNLLLRQNHCQP